MKISYISTYDALDIHQWSGVGYYIAKSLRDQGATLDYTTVLPTKSPIIRIKSLLYRKLTGETFLPDREVSLARRLARLAEENVPRTSDVLFSPGTLQTALLQTSKPKVFYTDATFAGMLGFYKAFSNICPESVRSGNEIEQAALSSCTMAIYASDWAAKTAINLYKVDANKVKVIPLGANIECNRTVDDIRDIVRKRSRTTCKLLFLGVDWERKGGDMALKVTKALNEAGLPTELHIAGVRTLPFAAIPDYVVNHGFISKATAEGLAALDKLFLESHFLILPTQAECFGVVFCEANSFGVPNISTRVGGVPTAVRDDIGGKLFPLSATDSAYATYIYDLFQNHSRYEDLAQSSFNEYKTRLNWQTSGAAIMNLLKDLC